MNAVVVKYFRVVCSCVAETEKEILTLCFKHIDVEISAWSCPPRYDFRYQMWSDTGLSWSVQNLFWTKNTKMTLCLFIDCVSAKWTGAKTN